jgi:protein involved in polysaccharide export with SLBB domain
VPPTDFQLYAATSTGKILPVFGRDLFADAPASYAPVVDAAPSAEYVVGPGDELLIRAWGQLDVDVRAPVSREGTISLPRIGVLSVSGLRYDELPARIEAAIGRYYRNFHLSVSIGQLRSIQVFVVGNAQRPGLYTVSSLSTLMNTLFACGGPSSTGTMRRVELRRGGKLLGQFDLYDVLLKGDKSTDQRLMSGDVIFIPPIGPVAAIVGPVRTPGIFELRGQETTLSELISYAGGLSTTAATQSVLLEHLEQRRGHVIEELPWGDAALGTRVRDGDIVQLRKVPVRFDNAITVRGSVIAAFRTAWRPGLRVSDIIPDRSVLISEGYWARAAARGFDDQATTDQAGEQHLKTEVQNLVDEVNWDYAVIERLDRDRLEPHLIPFNLGKAVIDRDPASNLPLESGDIVTVFSKKDILAPSAQRTLFVRIEGEVAVPGVYQVRPGDTLRQLVERAGGLTPSAYLFGSEFLRERVRVDQQARLDDLAERAEQDLERTGTERLGRALTPEDARTVRTQLDVQRSAIARMRTLRATGRMVLGLDPEAHRTRDLPDFTLEDGDRFFVPARYSTVGVYGAVYNQTNLLFRSGGSVDDYLQQAGGPTKAADSGSIFVLRADGTVISNRQTSWFSSFGSRRLYPNDNIVVPENYAPTSWIKELKDWSQIFYQFGLGVAAIRILR